MLRSPCTIVSRVLWLLQWVAVVPQLLKAIDFVSLTIGTDWHNDILPTPCIFVVLQSVSVIGLVLRKLNRPCADGSPAFTREGRGACCDQWGRLTVQGIAVSPLFRFVNFWGFTPWSSLLHIITIYYPLYDSLSRSQQPVWLVLH